MNDNAPFENPEEHQELKGTGLELAQGLNDDYGDQYTGEDGATGYASCLRGAGCIPQCICCVCVICGCGPIKEVQQGYIGLLIEFGKLKKKLGPGLHTINPMTEQILLVDLRAQVINVAKQSLLTKDNVTVHVDAYVNYKIVIPEFAIFKVANYYDLVNFMVQGVMKTIVAERTLTQLLVNRKEIEKDITQIIDAKTDDFGIKVISIETQSVQLPENMERAMATVAESEKEAEAKIIDARGNLESAKIFREAADELSKNPISLQLQYFETLREIAAEKNSTIIIPDSILSSLKR